VFISDLSNNNVNVKSYKVVTDDSPDKGSSPAKEEKAPSVPFHRLFRFSTVRWVMYDASRHV
jgi:hypothetical protein